MGQVSPAGAVVHTTHRPYHHQPRPSAFSAEAEPLRAAVLARSAGVVLRGMVRRARVTTPAGSDAVERFMRSVAGFRVWGETVRNRYGEWECDYSHWEEIYEAFRSIVASREISQWPPELVGTMLYVIARD